MLADGADAAMLYASQPTRYRELMRRHAHAGTRRSIYRHGRDTRHTTGASLADALPSFRAKFHYFSAITVGLLIIAPRTISSEIIELESHCRRLSMQDFTTHHLPAIARRAIVYSGIVGLLPAVITARL